VFWNRLDTVALKLQGWRKQHLKFGSCGKFQKSNKHLKYFSLDTSSMLTVMVSVCLCILSSTQGIFRLHFVMNSTEIPRLCPSLAKAGYLQVNTVVPAFAL